MKQRIYLVSSIEICHHGLYANTPQVATNDRDLKRRIRKVPGVPILSVARGKFVIERYVLRGPVHDVLCFGSV